MMWFAYPFVFNFPSFAAMNVRLTSLSVPRPAFKWFLATHSGRSHFPDAATSA
jgi:hypothetical protein